MSSLLTNTAAMTALTTLKNTNQDLEKSSGRIATGQKVATAADNAAYWSIATTIRADNGSLNAVKDAIGLGQGVTEFNPKGQAAAEVRKLWSWIEKRTQVAKHVKAA